jgi:hypothetical protein
MRFSPLSNSSTNVLTKGNVFPINIMKPPVISFFLDRKLLILYAVKQVKNYLKKLDHRVIVVGGVTPPRETVTPFIGRRGAGERVMPEKR